MLKVASWNVNSIKARLAGVLDWLGAIRPDVLLLQELKCVEEGFPSLEIEDLGYNIAVNGQKTYNGVAILSKRPIEVEARALPGDADDQQARYLEAVTGDLRVASLYLPNGNPVFEGGDKNRRTEKFAYKLSWMDRLIAHARELLATEDAFILGGDYNVCPTDDDVYDPEGWKDDALCRPESRARFRILLNMGLYDAFRAFHTEPHASTYWSYQGGAWEKDNGLRIDHLLLSPQAADRLDASGIDKAPRARPKASDHVPVWCELEEKT